MHNCCISMWFILLCCVSQRLEVWVEILPLSLFLGWLPNSFVSLCGYRWWKYWTTSGAFFKCYVSKVRGSSRDSDIIPLPRPPTQPVRWFVLWIFIMEKILDHFRGILQMLWWFPRGLTQGRGYPFHKTKYWRRQRCRHESSIWLTLYSSPIVNSTGGGGGA
jgi:hypothetical protein